MASEGLIEDFAQICTVISCFISSFMILGHLFYYNERNLQKYIIRILFIIPVYSCATLGGILEPDNMIVYAAIRDFYEAYVLYTFIQLLIQYLGGINSLQIHLEFKRRIRQPWPLDRVKPLQTDKLFMRRIKQAAL